MFSLQNQTSQIQRLNEASAKILGGSLKRPEPLTLSEWANKNYYLSPESSSIQAPWKTLPYQRGIMDIISNDDVRIITLNKSARVGYTKIIAAAIGYFAEQKKRNQLIYLPTDSDAKQFCQTEINPMHRDCQAVRDIMLVDPEKKSQHNTFERKSYLGSVLDIKGGKSGRNYRAMTKDVVIYDELDGFDRDIDGEGSPVNLGDVRVTTSSFSKSIRGSTPRVEETSLIIQSFNSADVRLSRHLNCPHCDHLSPLSFANFIDDNGAKSGKYACPECGAIIEYHDYADMDKNGIWKDPDLDIWYDEETQYFMQGSEIIPAPVHVGLHIWAAYSYFTTWKQLAAEFNSAKAEMKRGNIEPLKTFVNTKLGEGWKEVGEAPEDDQVKKMRLPIAPYNVPNDVQMITFSTDVQGDRLYYEARGWGYGLTSWQIYHGELFGNTKDSGDQCWEKLGSLIDTPIDGHAVQIALIDSGYNTDAVYDFCRLRPGRVYPYKGRDNYSRPVGTSKQDISVNGKMYPGGITLIVVDTGFFKTQVHSAINRDTDQDGAWLLNRATTDDYCLQMTAEHRIETKPGRYIWKRIKKDNHYFDCGVMNAAAAYFKGAYSFRKPDDIVKKKKRNKTRAGSWD